MTTKVDIDPRVALLELTERAGAERAFFTNRCLLLAQENHTLRQTIEAQKAEIEALKAGGAKTDEANPTEMERAKTSPMKTVLLSGEKKKA
ncbi:MAG: hypothetical protein ACTHJQ_27235 [Rhizobiaceae bacterium]